AGDRMDIAALRRASRSDKQLVLAESRDATLWNAGGVAVLEFHSKMNTLGAGVIDVLRKGLDLVDERGLAGLVIGNEDPRTFSAGADLMMVMSLIGSGDWKTLEKAVDQFQDTSLRIRRAPFPVVAAP